MSKFSVEEVSPIEKRIQVEVPPESVTTTLDAAYRTLSRQVKIPGFRQGKVPRRILESRFKEQVEADAIQILVEQSYREALKANPEVYPVAPPRVTNEGLKPGESFRYQAHVEVKPKIEPKDFEGLPIKKANVEITDQQIDQEVDRLRESMSQLVPVEGRTVAQSGDYAVVDFEGTIDGKPFPGSKTTDATVEIVPGDFTQGSLQALEGAAIDEVRDIPYSFPADYRMKELAGKTASFKVKLKALKAKKTPVADDALAKDVGAGDTLVALRDRIRTELTSRANEKAERELRDQVVKALIERNPFEVPRSLVERTVDRMLEGAFERFARQGIDPRRMNLDVPRLRDSLREGAVSEVKGTLLLEAIANKQDIRVTDADLDGKIQELATSLKAPVESVRAYLQGEEAVEGMRHKVREEKTLAFLASKANISQP